jgi:hypothetical protein
VGGFLASLLNRGAVADPDPQPGIGGYRHPRGKAGEDGYPGSTSSTRTDPPAAAGKLHDGTWGRGGFTGIPRRFGVRMPTVPAQQANVIPPPAHDGSLPYQGPDAKTNPDRVRDTEQRPRVVISAGIPGGQRQRNSVYFGAGKAVPGEVHSYRPAPNPGKGTWHGEGPEVTVPSRYVFGGVNGGTDNLDDSLTARRMPYTGHGGSLQDVAPFKGGRSVRGAVLDGRRFYQQPDTELNQGGAYGHYGARQNVLHRPTVFSEPAPWSAQFYDTTAETGSPDVPGASSQVVQAVHVSPAAARRGWSRRG